MSKRADITLIVLGILLAFASLFLVFSEARMPPQQAIPGFPSEQVLLTDPFLQFPTPSSVRVVWFTEFEGASHVVAFGRPGQSLDVESLDYTINATTTRLSRVREDQDSHVNLVGPDGQLRQFEQPTRRDIWRHEAEVSGLTPGTRIPYKVLSLQEGGQLAQSRVFSLAPAPAPEQRLQILLTSDHQLMPMTPANLQQVEATVGQVDGVFMAGDLVNIPDRASEWFDDSQGNAFFPALQGRAAYVLEAGGQRTQYRGGELIQHAPLFPALGNHEVMGRYASTSPLNQQFNDPIPRQVAANLYQKNADLFNPEQQPNVRQRWLKNNSFNTDTYEEIFSLPETTLPDGSKTRQYYATTFGDIRLISLYVTNIWRTPSVQPDARGRYREREQDVSTPANWGYGQHIFESIAPGSPQYRWLQQELASPAFKQAKYKIVMFHHPPHSLGDNIVPPFTDPVALYDRNPDGSLKAIRYEYPKPKDYITRDLVPLLESAGVNLVFYGHSHLWNRFVSPGGMHFLESSNVGNTYGAYTGDKKRAVPPTEDTPALVGYRDIYYAATGDPNGLEPVMPTIAPLEDGQGNPIPYIASNEITAFSILDTGTGRVSSYYFDTRKPTSKAVKFDEFSLLDAP